MKEIKVYELNELDSAVQEKVILEHMQKMEKEALASLYEKEKADMQARGISSLVLSFENGAWFTGTMSAHLVQSLAIDTPCFDRVTDLYSKKLLQVNIDCHDLSEHGGWATCHISLHVQDYTAEMYELCVRLENWRIEQCKRMDNEIFRVSDYWGNSATGAREHVQKALEQSQRLFFSDGKEYKEE